MIKNLTEKFRLLTKVYSKLLVSKFFFSSGILHKQVFHLCADLMCTENGGVLECYTG